jgi:mono/diheme cytochrome c family protein
VLLSVTAEVEHALLVEYRYAALSMGKDPAAGRIRDIAIQEMCRLVSVQNLLLFAGPCTVTDDEYEGPVDPAGEGGESYLSNNCYGCHGGRAGGGMGPNFRRERPESGDLGEAVRQGEEGGMPAYRNLTATDITNLSGYFKTLGTTAEPTFTRWWETIPTLNFDAHQNLRSFGSTVNGLSVVSKDTEAMTTC